MLKRAPERVQAPQTLFASIATPSAIAFLSSTIQSVLPDGRIAWLCDELVATDTAFDWTLQSSIAPLDVSLMNVRAANIDESRASDRREVPEVAWVSAGE